ncbi:MAG: hypothetical protein AB7R40_23250 [Nitrospiraceae bacterium]
MARMLSSSEDRAADAVNFGPSAQDMTLRDYYAGQALVGILAGKKRDTGLASKDAYDYADAMMRARGRNAKG